MAAFEFKLPDIGEGVAEGEIVKWLVKEGDSIKEDQPIVEVMTDKATVEIPSPVTGKIVKRLCKDGDVVKVGAGIVEIDSQSGIPAQMHHGGGHVQTGTPAAASPAQAASKPAPAAAPRPQAMAAPTPRPQQQAAPSYAAGGVEMAATQTLPPADFKVLATPATRRLAREMGIDINQVHGSGPNGRVIREDLQNVRGQQGTGAVAAGRPSFQAPAFNQLPSQPGQLEERKPFRGIRKKVAEKMVLSKQIIPHFTLGDEVDVTEMVHLRASLKEQAQGMGVKLTYLPFIMKALVATCREFPQFNASIDDGAGEVVYRHYFNVGFAADTPEGLVVPVVKNVERKSVLQCAAEIQQLAEKARAQKLAVDDMRGGTISITNIGSVGGTFATPIINHPEVAILGIYKIVEKPVVIKGEIKIRSMMGVTVTCDHRLVDGAVAAHFLKQLIPRLENPQAMLLEMI